MTPEPDDDTVTDEDLKAAQERWADPQHEGTVKELFSRPVYGDGFRGDVPLKDDTAEPTDDAGESHA